MPVLIFFGVFAKEGGSKAGLLPIIAVTCFFAIFITLLLGPQMARNDLRQDLASLAVLKTWPMTGATLVRGELLAPAVVLTCIAWTLIAAGAALSTSLQIDDGTALLFAMHRVGYAIAAAVVVPGIIMAQLVVVQENGLAIMFPAWVTIGTSRARGVEATGQRMLMMAGNILTLVIAILPGAIVGGGVALIIYFATGVVTVVACRHCCSAP